MDSLPDVRQEDRPSFFSLLDNFLRILKGRTLAAVFVAYAVLWIVVSIPLSRETMLSNWDLSYPLVIGNVPNGEYPWHGQILEFKLADRALTLPTQLMLFRMV